MDNSPLSTVSFAIQNFRFHNSETTETRKIAGVDQSFTAQIHYPRRNGSELNETAEGTLT